MVHAVVRLGLMLGAGSLLAADPPPAAPSVPLPPGMPGTGLLFYAGYNAQSEKATIAGGKAESLNFRRSLQFEQIPGISGAGFQTLAGETCLYGMKGNFDPRQGTLSLWVRPDNWKPGAGKAMAFFIAEIPGVYRLLLAADAPTPTVTVDFALPALKLQPQIRGEVKWETGKWHRVDLTWDAARVRLFLDGAVASETALPAGTVLPEAVEAGTLSVNPNGYLGKDTEALTTVDEALIYSQVLTENELKESYDAAKSKLTGTYRNPVVTIPLDRQAPQIDGILDPAEWQHAAVILPKNLGGRAQFTAKTAHLYLKYDDTCLYLGFHAPEDAKPLANIRARDGYVWEDGALEFVCSPGSGDDPPVFQIAINSLGVVFDMLKGDAAWNGIEKAAAKVAGPSGGWSAEAAVPFAALGVPVPKPGDSWRGNVMYDWDQRAGGYATWSTFILGAEGYFGNRRTFGTFTFGTEQAGVRLSRLGDLTAGVVDAAVEVAPRAGEQNVEFQLVSDRSGPQVSAVTAKTAAPAEFKKELPAGAEGLFSITVKNAAGQAEFVYDQAFKVQPPLVLTVNCFPSHQRADVSVDLGNAPADIRDGIAAGNLTGEVTLKNTAGEMMASAAWKPKQMSDHMVLPWKEILPPGKYRLQVTFPGAGGRRCEQGQDFEVPSYEPFTARAGIGHEVPEPWVPIRLEADRAVVLNREYFLDNSPFPKQFRSLGDDLLTRPVQLKMLTDKGPETLAWGTRRLVSQDPDKVVFAGEGRGALSGITVRWTAELEFDGQWLVRLTLEPGDQPVNLERLELEYAVKVESASYVLAFLLKPWQDNVVALDLFDGIDGVDSPASPRGTFWLTGMKTGLHFFTPTDANWVVPRKVPNVRLERSPTEVTARVTIIATPTTIARPAAYLFGLTATPAKPQPVKNWSTGDHEYIFQVGPWQNWTSLVHMQPEALRTSLEAKRKKGLKYFYEYTFPGICGKTGLLNNEKDREDPYCLFWGAEWSSNKQANNAFAGCPNSTLQDLIPYRVEALARDFGVGPYFDMCGIGWCGNDEHGCGVTDSFGRQTRTMPILGFRELLKRSYIVAHRYSCRVWNHNHSQFCFPAHTFSDIWFPGEQYTSGIVGNNHFYSRTIKREEYLVEMNPFIHGVTMLFLPEVVRAYDLSGDKEFEKYFKPEYAWYTEQLLAQLLPHDIDNLGANMNTGPVERVYAIYAKLKVVARDNAPGPRAVFTGYWDNPTIKTDDAEVMLSTYTFAGEKRAVAVLANPTLAAKTVRLSLDRQRLVFDGALTVRDEYRDRDLPDWETKGVEVPAESFAILTIAPVKI